MNDMIIFLVASELVVTSCVKFRDIVYGSLWFLSDCTIMQRNNVNARTLRLQQYCGTSVFKISRWDYFATFFYVFDLCLRLWAFRTILCFCFCTFVEYFCTKVYVFVECFQNELNSKIEEWNIRKRISLILWYFIGSKNNWNLSSTKTTGNLYKNVSITSVDFGKLLVYFHSTLLREIRKKEVRN